MTDEPPTIADQLRASRGLLIGTAILGFGAVAADLAAVHFERTGVFPRLLLGTIVLLVYVQLVASFGARSIPGFRLPSRAEWRRWLLLFAGAAIFLAAGAIASRRYFGFTAPPRELATIVVYNCLLSPIYEEVIYRLAFCTPTAALAGRTPAILVNGLVFAALHVVYGNPDPSNAIGGFVLAWIYLRSRSLVVAIIAHAIGNAAINFAPIIFAHLAR